MNCPKCVGKLEEKNIENVKTDVCWVCEGIWFDKDELEKVLEADSKDFNKIDLDRGGLDGKEVSDVYKELDEKSIKCPRCGEELKKELYPKGIRIDTCAKCDGIWLDGGEIHKLRERTLVKLADTVYTLKIAFAQALRSALQGRKKRKI